MNGQEQSNIQPQEPKKSSNKTLWTIIIIVIVLAIIGLLLNFLVFRAGKNFIEKGMEQALGGEVEFGTEETGFSSKNIPDNCPKDIIIYPGAGLLSAFCGMEGGNNHTIMLLSQDSQTDIMAYYETELKKQGWETTGEKMFLAGMASAAYKKGDVVTSINVASDPQSAGETSIGISIMPSNLYFGY